WRIPAAGVHPCQQNLVEQRRARRGEQNPALVATHPTTLEHRQRLAHVVAAAAKALLTEEVRYAAGGDLLQPRVDGRWIALNVTQHQHETVPGQRAARQLFCVPRV